MHHELAQKWYELFSRYAEDLYPGRYTKEKCLELAELGLKIKELAKQKQSLIVAHNYLYPEFHEIADMVGDSLALSLFVREKKAPRVDFASVFFMGETAKIINGEKTRVFVEDNPQILGCSLVSGIDHAWIKAWRKKNPEGIIITYINSDAYTKSLSDYISTSRNTDKLIIKATKENPNKKILVLPDKFLGRVMKIQALHELGPGFNADLIEIYEHNKGNFRAACHVHEQIGQDASEVALAENPDAELMIHPECGCATSCLLKLEKGEIPHGKAYFLSTEQMVTHARASKSKKFIVATEKGMVYRLRKEMPKKTFIPISSRAECGFMKANTFEKLLNSLQNNRTEIVICDDCCDPENPYQDEKQVHIPKSTTDKALIAINKMMD